MARVIEIPALGRHDLVNVAGRLCLGIDAVNGQAGHCGGSHDEGEVGRRVCRGEMDRVATGGEPDGDGCGNGGLADAAFAHDHDETLAACGDFIDQRRQAGKVGNFEAVVGGINGKVGGGLRQEPAQGIKPHHVEGFEGNLVPGER